jgi:hypothetical protein
MTSTPISPLTGSLCGLLAIHALLIPLTLHTACGTPRAETLVHHVDAFAAGVQAGDSWRPMAAARTFARERPGESIYQEVFFNRQNKFIYPPTSLLFIGDLSRPTLNLLSWLAVCITIALTVTILERSVGRHGAAPTGAIDRAVRLAAASGLALTFYPLLKAYSLGQIQVWIDALAAGLVLAWLHKRLTIGGVLLGLMCLIKPHFILLIGWAAFRRQWPAVLAGTITVAAGLLWSISVFGWSTHVDYLSVLSYIGQRGDAFYPNQSFNGFFNRLAGNGDNLTWHDEGFAPFHPGVYAATVTAAVALGAIAILRPRRREDAGGVTDLAVAIVTAVVISPIAWEHHFGVLLPVFAATAPRLVAPPCHRWTALLLAASFVLTGQFLFPAQRLAASWLNVAQSYVLAGALLLLALLWAALRPRSAAPSTLETRINPV